MMGKAISSYWMEFILGRRSSGGHRWRPWCWALLLASCDGNERADAVDHEGFGLAHTRELPAV
jgi:hypothetical protein